MEAKLSDMREEMSQLKIDSAVYVYDKSMAPNYVFPYHRHSANTMLTAIIKHLDMSITTIPASEKVVKLEPIPKEKKGA